VQVRKSIKFLLPKQAAAEEEANLFSNFQNRLFLAKEILGIIIDIEELDFYSVNENNGDYIHE